MKKIVLMLFVAVLINAAARAEEKPIGVREFTSINELATAIISYFPKVQGEVKAVQGDTLMVSLGSKNGLKSGVTLELWRAGKEILHPVSGAVLGRAEEAVGDAEVMDVGETSSTVRIIKKAKDPKPGDTARITPKKIRLALIPLRPDRTDVLLELAAWLKEQGRFSVLETEKAAAFLKDRKQRDSSLIKEMGHTFGLDVVTAIEVYPSEGGKLLTTVRMFSAADARPIDTIMVMLDLKSKKETMGEIRPFFAPENGEPGFFAEGKRFTVEGKDVTAKLPFDAQLLAVGDLEGNGMLHYVFSDGEEIHIYRQEAKGWREEWSENRSYVAGKVQHINIDIADINGNGKPEIFVTAMQNDKVISYVMELQDGSCKRIAAMPGFLRIVKYPGKGNVLLAQSYEPKYFYVGKPKQYTWSEGKYIVGQEFPLPKGVNLYGFAVANTGEVQPLLVALNDKYQLVVYSSNNAIWKTEEQYPADGVTIDKPSTDYNAPWIKDAAEQAERMGNPPIIIKPETITIRGRVYALDIDGDGRDEIFVPKNGVIPYLDYISMTTVTKFRNAEFAGLSWTGTRLEQRLTIKNIPGVVKDFQVLGQQGKPSQIFALVSVPSWWWFGSDTIQVMSYTVK